MLLTETVKITCRGASIKLYESKGYTNVKYNTEIEVKISDISKTNHKEVEVKCDYCGKHFSQNYNYYLNIQERYKDSEKKDACKECDDKRKHEEIYIKIENKESSCTEYGFWMVRKNRLSVLNEYIIKNNYYIKHFFKTKQGKQISQKFRLYEDDICKSIEDLGYNVDDILGQKTENYYDDFDKLEQTINYFIKNNNRFPSVTELSKVLFVGSGYITKHGGMDNIKTRMHYCDKKDLIDDNGFYNKSLYEYYTAQFLISNNIKYKREEHPFPSYEGNYRSDFTFITENDEKLHCEVWGYDNRKSEKIDTEYNKVKDVKIKLYEKYNLRLIEIDKDIFRYKNFENINKNLKDIFEPLFSLHLKNANIQKYIPSHSLTNEDILNEVMNYSTKDMTLPPITKLKENNCNRYYKEILKRFSTYDNFAKSMGLYSPSPNKRNSKSKSINKAS